MLQSRVERELALFGHAASWLDYRLYLCRMYGFLVPVERVLRDTPELGPDYIVKLKSTVEPFILSGGSNVIRDAVVRGQFAIGFSGRGDFFQDLERYRS